MKLGAPAQPWRHNPAITRTKMKFTLAIICLGALAAMSAPVAQANLYCDVSGTSRSGRQRNTSRTLAAASTAPLWGQRRREPARDRLCLTNCRVIPLVAP